MTAHDNLRTTTAVTTVPNTRHSPAGSRVGAVPRWVGPAAMFAVAITAFVGVDELRSTDDAAPTRPVTTAPDVKSRFEPLIGVEERAIINGEFPRLAWPSVATSTAMEPLIGVEERAIINGEYPRLPIVDLCATHNPC